MSFSAAMNAESNTVHKESSVISHLETAIRWAEEVRAEVSGGASKRLMGVIDQHVEGLRKTVAEIRSRADTDEKPLERGQCRRCGGAKVITRTRYWQRCGLCEGTGRADSEPI